MIPVLYVGMPGIGKTAKIHQQYDYVEVILASCMVEEDIAGIPYRDGKYDYRTIPAAIRRLEDAASKGLTTALFLDELDKARRSVADTLLTLVAGRRIGEAELPKNTDIIAAANPPEWGGGDGVSDAMLSRFSIIESHPSITEWSSWAKEQYKEHDACMAIIEAVGKAIIPIADISGEDFKRRITCPRTLTMALDCIKDGKKNYKDIVMGLLTPASASTFINLIDGFGCELEQESAIVRSKAEKINPSPIRL